MQKSEQQQQQSGFTRRNSKKIKDLTSKKSVSGKDLVYTKTTTYVEVSQPQVTVTEKVLASKVTKQLPPSEALKLMATNGGSLPFIDCAAETTTRQSSLQTEDALQESQHCLCALLSPKSARDSKQQNVILYIASFKSKH